MENKTLNMVEKEKDQKKITADVKVKAPFGILSATKKVTDPLKDIAGNISLMTEALKEQTKALQRLTNLNVIS